jgi:hypothetical protein
LNVAKPVTVDVPRTERLFLTVVVPVVAPRVRVVAALPIFSVVAVALKRFAVVAVVVTFPPLTAMSPAVVTFPVRVKIPSIISVPLA